MNPYRRYLSMHPCRVAALLVLLVSPPVVPAEAQMATLPSGEFNPRKVPQFQQKVSGEFFQPTAVQMIENLRQQTNLNLALDDSVIHDRPIQGYTKFQNAPAWGVMDQLARNKYVLGRWRKVGNEYRLFATYKGPPPPRPPEIPPDVVRAIKNDTDAESGSESPKQASPADSSPLLLRYLLSVIPLFIVGVIMLWIRRRQAQPSTALSVHPTVSKSSSSK